MSRDVEGSIRLAAEAIAGAEALVIAAGAGMGVDSGLPDFRGPEGFWRAYPPYARLGLGFSALANPRWFRDDPALAWGFYGHRMHLYRETRPHPGFAILKKWAEALPSGAFVFTSNVDGQFQRAGFDPDRIVEVHGSIHWMQCLNDCGADPFPSDPYSVSIDRSTMLASPPFPGCPRCGSLARPNILMFGDSGWDSDRSEAQHRRLKSWLPKELGPRLVVVECGAGLAVPSVRLFTEDVVSDYEATLIRLNPREPEVPAGQIGLPIGAFEGLRAIDERLGTSEAGSPGPGQLA